MNWGLVIVFLVFFIINLFSIEMLNRVYSQKKLGSFQEMAWSTSQGNRGYIFLISAMQVIYLVVTSAYCISFVASFLTGLVGLIFPPAEQLDVTRRNWINYGIYAVFVVILSAAAYFAQKNKEPQTIH